VSTEEVGLGGTVERTTVPAIALPLYQGKMIWQFDYSRSIATGLSGKAAWAERSQEHLVVQGQYLIGAWQCEDGVRSYASRLMFRDIQNATNQRTFIGALTYGSPAGNTVPILRTERLLGPGSDAALLAALCSFPLDRSLRIKMSQNHVSWFYADEVPIPIAIGGHVGEALSKCVARAFAPGQVFAVAHTRHFDARHADRSWRSSWALTTHERLRARCSIDAVVSACYGLSEIDLRHFLTDCDHPTSRSTSNSFTGTLDQKGFWRVDKDKDPELRHTVLTLVAYHDLQKNIAACHGDRDRGIEVFLTQNDGQGWLLPETLCLAEHDLGHDDRARSHQSVAGRLGPRYFDWQLTQSAEESWRECHLHARNLLGEDRYQRLLAGDTSARGSSNDEVSRVKSEVERPGAKQAKLFW
jgi:hypothetical protein